MSFKGEDVCCLFASKSQTVGENKMQWHDCKLFRSQQVVDWSYELPEDYTGDMEFKSSAMMLLKDDLTDVSNLGFNEDHSCFGVNNVNMWTNKIKPLYLGNVYGAFDENSPLEDSKCLDYCLQSNLTTNKCCLKQDTSILESDGNKGDLKSSSCYLISFD